MRSSIVETLKASNLFSRKGDNQLGIVILIVDYLSKGLDKESWKRLMQLHQRSVSIAIKFSLIHVLGLFLSMFCMPT
jgi:hypothetical protein